MAGARLDHDVEVVLELGAVVGVVLEHGADELARDVLAAAGALRGQSDHGVSKSLYAADPDGNEFELMYLLAEDEWGEYATRAVVQPLDLESEVARRS